MTTTRIVMLDPAGESDLAFYRGLLPETGFELVAPEPDTAASPE